jgi:hypothetical protein
MTSAYSINLNFNNTIPVKTDFTFKQGDKGITLNLATTGLDTTGTTAHIVFKRSNGTSVEAELTGQTGPSYSYTILGNEFEIPGVVVADLKLYNGDTQRVSTASFIFLVTGDTMDGVGGGTGGYSDQLEELSQEFSDTLEEYKDAFGDVGAVNPRGAYDSAADYNVLDLVSYQGSSYLCRTACKNKVPTNTTYWQVFASGSGGVDYNDVSNKPSINNVTLSGDQTTADLGLFSGDYDDLENKPTIPSDFDDLADVDMAGVTDGQVPTWDATAGKYKPGTPAGGSGGTNPNLLMNPWFTVNQRGFSSSSSTDKAFCVDRWRMTYGSSPGTVALTANGLQMTSSTANDNVVIYQEFEDASVLNGKTVTASVLLSDGTIVSGTIQSLNVSASSDFVPFGTGNINLQWTGNKTYTPFRVRVKSTLTIRAVKLEVGSTSTLHLDTAPDYSTELLKCQRYFVRIKGNSSNTGFSSCFAKDSTNARVFIPATVPMRIIPTLTYSGSFYILMAGSSNAVTAIQFMATQIPNLYHVSLTSSNLTAGYSGLFYASGDGDYIDLDAEL